MDIDLALLADAATIDSSGKLNILGVFDRIASSRFPVQHGRIALVVRFSSGSESAGVHEVAIRLRGPGGEVLRLDGRIQVGGGPGARGPVKVPQVFNLDGLVVPEPGSFAFDILVDGVHQTSVPLEVIRVTGPQPPLPPPGFPTSGGIQA